MNDKNRKIDLTDALEERSRRTSHLTICPTCGKQNCINIWHIIKLLSTRSRYEMRARDFFIFHIYIMIIALIALVIYCLFTFF